MAPRRSVEPRGRDPQSANRTALVVASVIGAGTAAVVAVMVSTTKPSSQWWLAIAVMVAVDVVVVLLALRWKQRMRERRSAQQSSQTSLIAAEAGLSPMTKAEGEIRSLFGRLPEVRKHGKIKRTFSGERLGRHVIAFEHMHMIHTGNATVPIYKTVYAIETPPWPRVDVVPQLPIGRFIRRLLGRRGMELDLPEFNRRFSVRATEEDFAVVLLSREVQRHILSKPGVTWRLIDGWLCLIYPGRLRLPKAGVSLDRLERLAQLVAPELSAWESAST